MSSLPRKTWYDRYKAQVAESGPCTPVWSCSTRADMRCCRR